MRGRSRVWKLTFFVIVVAAAIAPRQHAGRPSRRRRTLPQDAPTTALLPRNAVVSLNLVERYFPEITSVVRSGDDETATGDPLATRSVTFANAAGTKKVTISADRFGGPGDASFAYRDAVAKSKAVTGFKLLAVPNLGEKTFAGTVTQGSETHVGLGVLVGRLTVGVTLAGFDAGSANVGRLVSVARAGSRGRKCSQRVSVESLILHDQGSALPQIHIVRLGNRYRAPFGLLVSRRFAITVFRHQLRRSEPAAASSRSAGRKIWCRLLDFQGPNASLKP